MKRNFNQKQTKTEVEVLESIRQQQLTINAPQSGRTIGGRPTDSTDLLDAIQRRDNRILSIRERRLQHPNFNQELTTDESAATINLYSQASDNNFSQTENLRTETSVYEGFNHFFHNDAFGRPTILNLHPTRTTEQIIEQGGIPQVQNIRQDFSHISPNMNNSLLRLQTEMRSSINNLRELPAERLANYRNQVNYLIDPSNMPSIRGIDFLQTGFYTAFTLMPAPVLLYILSNIEMSSVTAAYAYTFISAMLSLFRPFFTTVTNVNM